MDIPTDNQDNTRPDPKRARVVLFSPTFPAAHYSPTWALKVRWRIWPWFSGYGLMALSNRRQTSLNLLSEGTRHEYLSD